MTSDRIAEIVAEVMPIADGGETGEALRQYIRAAIASTKAAEREACAKLADLQAALDRRQAELHRDTDNSFDDCAITAESIARAIRFRTTLEQK